MQIFAELKRQGKGTASFSSPRELANALVDVRNRLHMDHSLHSEFSLESNNHLSIAAGLAD